MNTGWARRLQRLDAFRKMDSSYQARSSSGGLLSVVVILTMLLMLLGELHNYLKYKQVQTFSIDTNMSHPLQINLGVFVAMPCALIRVDVLDVSGTQRNVHSSIALRTVHREEAFGPKQQQQQQRRVNTIRDMHVHDIIAEAGQQRRGSRGRTPLPARPAPMVDRIEDAACHIEGSMMVGKVSGLLHITAHGHGHGGAYVPQQILNFTHHIDELSFGALYPNLVNPLDNTRHEAADHHAAFSYFISVVPTTYIDPGMRVLETNQYAVNEYYRSRKSLMAGAGADAEAEADTKLPGIFFEYGIESISVTVRERRDGFVGFVVRLCAAISGLFVTAGVIHRMTVGMAQSVTGSRAAGSAVLPSNGILVQPGAIAKR
ncbi:hypothetical protein GGF37_005359 [Kickxella alabastrina]|nr:hypothetical protein GGF37_005359 [Kickxella alabastrina]